MPAAPIRLTFQALGKHTELGFRPASTGRVTVNAYEGEKVIARFDVAPNSPRSRKQCFAYGLDDATTLSLLDETTRTGQVVTWNAPVEAAPLPPGHITVTVREKEAAEGVDHTGTPVDLLATLFPTVPTTLFLAWKGREELCCLDIDYHESTPPIPAWLETMVEARIAPRPVMWHFSRGGGLHLFYVRTDRFTAEELAATAALRFRLTEPTAGLDLVTTVRGPGEAVIRSGSLQDTTGTLASWLKGAVEADPNDVEDWLATNQMEKGGKYDHTRCPINPTPGYTSTGDPVRVIDAGVFCHRCGVGGLSLGSRRPGLATWAALTGTTGSSDVGRMVKELVHWGHARWTLVDRYGLPASLARLAYGAAIKAAHEDISDARFVSLFSRETECMSRSPQHLWVNLESDSYVYSDKPTLKSLLSSFPACTFDDADGKMKANTSRVAHYLQGHSLSDRGYTPVHPVLGFRLTRQYLPDVRPGTFVSLLTRDLRNSPRAPRYVLKTQRKEVAWAEGVFEKHFPGICWTLIRSQICASGAAQEVRRGTHPLTFVCGGTGTAKSTHMKIVAGILGTGAQEATYHQDEDKFKRAIAFAGNNGAFAVCNEYLKEYGRAMKSYNPATALDFFLNLTPEALCHVMFVGPRPLGRIPAVVLTEPQLPAMLLDAQQIARRLRTVKLYGEKKAWIEKMSNLGLTTDTINLFRLRDAELAEASDVILSDVVDSYFAGDPMSWDEMADALELPTVRDCPYFDDPLPFKLAFFRFVCLAPPISDPRIAKNYGKGYKQISRSDSGGDEATEGMYDMWSLFANGPHDKWLKSDKLEENNWGDILGVAEKVDLDTKTDGVGNVFVRFRVGHAKNPLALNEQCAPAMLAKLNEEKEREREGVVK